MQQANSTIYIRSFKKGWIPATEGLTKEVYRSRHTRTIEGSKPLPGKAHFRLLQATNPLQIITDSKIQVMYDLGVNMHTWMIFMPQDKSKTAFTSPERHPNLALAIDQANASIENHCQSLILYQLLKHAPQTLATLASRLDYSETKLTQDLKHLQKLGLLSTNIARTDSPMYTLSDTGWRLAKDISYQLNSANDSTPFRLSHEESNLIKALLNKL